MLRPLLSTLLAAALAVAGPPFLEEEEAQKAFEEAQRAFSNEDFAGAAAALERAYGIEPNPTLLYAWAQAERMADNCEEAVGLYREFIDSGPPADQLEAAQANLARCEAQLPEPAPEPAPAPAPAPTPAPEPAPAPQADHERPLVLDPIGLGVGGAGVVAAGVGIGLLVSAGNRRRAADAADLHQDYRDLTQQAISRQRGGAVLLGFGLALMAGAGVRYGLLASEKKRRRASAHAWAGREGAGLAVSGRF